MAEAADVNTRMVVKPDTDIIASTSSKLKNQLKDLVNNGTKELVIDLERVEMIDSVGLGLFIAAYNSLNKVGGKLAVINASRDLIELFKNMRLDQRLGVTSTPNRG